MIAWRLGKRKAGREKRGRIRWRRLLRALRGGIIRFSFSFISIWSKLELFRIRVS